MGEVSTVGIDLAKSVFQVHGADAVVVRVGDVERLSREDQALRMVELGAFEHTVGETLVSAADQGLHRAFEVRHQDAVVARVGDEQPLALRVREDFPGVAEDADRRLLQPHDRRVLIVDNDTNLARAIERTLRRAGFETAVAHDGFQAGALAETFAPSAMTLDLRMPGLRGLDVIGFVRGRENLKNIGILVVSAMPPEDLEEALKAGADDVLAKPFENAALVEKVSRLTGAAVGAP